MDIEAIYQVRAASNAALAARDLVRLASCWAPDYMVITSANRRSIGQTPSLKRLESELAAKPDLEIIREPAAIHVFDAWGMAHEEGRWRVAWIAPDGAVRIGGSYCAKWQKYQDAGWLIEAEFFTPAYCNGGSDCARALPVLQPRTPSEHRVG
jgi:ketosteroid isomerase-like protein